MKLRQVRWEGQFPHQGALTNDEEKRLRQYWRTPEDLIEQMEVYFNGVFILDLCAATADSGVCKHVITETENVFRTDIKDKYEKALQSEWNVNVENPLIFMNPPYYDPRKFITRAIEACELTGAPVVCLLKGDTSTSWFEDLVWKKAARVIFPNKRISHDKPDFRTKGSGGNEFASVIAVYQPNTPEFGSKREIERLYIGAK